MLVNNDCKMNDKVIEAMEDFAMLESHDALVIGVSGGADSMALLHFFSKFYPQKHDIIAAHVNHNIRGEESIRDENFVKEYCKKNEIKLELLSVDVKKEATNRCIGIEECARYVRYDFFYKIAKKYNAKIATAHTLSDVTETLIFNLTRGTGLKGICSIPAKRENLIRPLIYVTRNEIEDYCKENKLLYVTDSTNSDVNLCRNRIRHNIIPELKKINPNFESAVLRFIKSAKQDEAYLEYISMCKFNDLADNEFDVDDLESLEMPILSRVIKLIVGSEYNLEHKHINLIYNIIRNKKGAVNIPGNKSVLIKNNKLICDTKSKVCFNDSNWKKNIKGINFLTVEGKTFIIKTVNKIEFDKMVIKNKSLFKNSIDYDKINDKTIFRNRRVKDKFKKAGSSVTKTLKKLFNEHKINVCERNSILILETDGQIIWIEGFGPSDYAKVTEKTKFVTLILPEGEKNV